MPDVHDKVTRSRNMAAIKSKNTKPELLIRSLLHRRGFRYRLHDKLLPGKPDMVFPKYNAVIFVHGCFWHRHDCPLFRMPASNVEFWQSKISKNQQNDAKSIASLRRSGFRVMTIWECALRGKAKLDSEKMVQIIVKWLCGTVSVKQIAGRA